MKLLLAIFAALIIPIAVCTQQQDTIPAHTPKLIPFVDKNRVFIKEFIQEARQNQCNATGREGAEKAVYEIFYNLFDPAFLNSQGISAKPFRGPYHIPQTFIHYSVLLSKSEFNSACNILVFNKKPRRNITNKPSGRHSSIEDRLLYFDLDKFPSIKIAPFFAQTKFNADSVLYITRNKENQLLEFVKGLGYDTGINSLLSVTSDGWGALYLDRQLYIQHILFQPNLQRALVKVQSGTFEGTDWNILIKRTRNGSWKVVALPHTHGVFLT